MQYTSIRCSFSTHTISATVKYLKRRQSAKKKLALAVWLAPTVCINVQRYNYTIDTYSCLGDVHDVVTPQEELVVGLHHLGADLLGAFLEHNVHESVN